MIVHPALYNSPKPSTRLFERAVHAFTQLGLNSLQRRAPAFRDAVSLNSEPTLCPSLATPVCESKKVERFGAAFITLRSTINRIATELDQTRLSFVELQTKLHVNVSNRRQRRYADTHFATLSR
jgi:wyosine [tRNA(Phe)-imidazoG37] synthetase (radical SAM superfamily)